MKKFFDIEILKNLKDKIDLPSMVGKVGNLFNPTPQKEKVLRREDFNAAGDTYYASVSVAYKIIERVLIIILAIFLVVSLVSNFSLITYDNFFYLLKDFSAAVDIETSTYNTLSYGSNTRHFFSLYRDGLVMANPSNVSAYTASGRRTLNIASQFSSPCVVSSDKYFLVYDTAGTTFAIYNSFSRVFSETLDYPITDACFASDGTFAITTRDLEHRSIVHIYDSKFQLKHSVFSPKYAFDIAMNSDHGKLAITYLDPSGSGNTIVNMHSFTDMSNPEQIVIDGEFPYASGFLANGYFSVITKSGIHIYDRNYEELDSSSYANANISGFFISEHGAAVSYTENSKNYVVAFDGNGNCVFDEGSDTLVNDIGIYDGYLFLRTDLGVTRIDYRASKHASLNSGQGKMLIYDANTVLICGESKAEYIVF